MSVGQKLFNVVTEFRFEIGSAVANAEQLGSATDRLSAAADNAIFSFQQMGLSLAGSLGIGPGGVLGILHQAIQASDKFKQSQLALANVMGDGSQPFLERMNMAAETMQRINKLAQEFALPSEDLLEYTKVLGPMLQSHGVKDPGFSRSIDISRSLLKSAPTLGVDPGLVGGQLQRMIGGQASTGDTLFNRLTGDTNAMKQFSGNSKAFNVLPIVKRVEVLQAALKQFSSDADVLSGNVRTLRGQMQLLKESISGAFSILKPIGDRLMDPIINSLMKVNAWLRSDGAMIAKSISRLIEPFIANPEQLLATLMQLKQLKADLNLAGTILTVSAGLIGLEHVLLALGIRIPIVSSLLGILTGAIRMFEANIFMVGTRLAGMNVVFGFLNGAVVLLSRIFMPLLLLVGVFQLLSRAVAIAKINDAKEMLNLAPRFAEAMAQFGRVFDFFLQGFDAIAQFIAPVFQMSFWFDMLISSMEGTVTVMTLVIGGFQGLIFAVMEFFSQLKSVVTGGGFSFGAIGDAFNAGVTDVIEKVLGKIESGDGGVMNQTTNIGKIEIKNQFKENLEPDRIAFTMVEQFKKTAQNPTQARGRSFGFSGSSQ